MKVETSKLRNVERVMLRIESRTDVPVLGILVHAHGWELDPSGEACWIPAHLTVDQVTAALRDAVGTTVFSKGW